MRENIEMPFPQMPDPLSFSPVLTLHLLISEKNIFSCYKVLNKSRYFKKDDFQQETNFHSTHFKYLRYLKYNQFH